MLSIPMLRRASISNAAEPVTMGAAPEVPPNAAVPVKLPDIAETDAPGAPISGLTMLSSKRGPREDVEAIEPASDNVPVGENRTTAAPVRSTAASELLIMNAGMPASPPPLAPANGASAVTTPMMPRMPPAALMFAILRLNEQLPRSTNTILPVSSPATYGVAPVASAQPRRLPEPVGPATKTGPSIVVVSGADQGWKIAPRFPVTGASSCMICNEAEGTAVCATDNADDAAAGDPVMNCLPAALPADAMVRTPAEKAASTAA